MKAMNAPSSIATTQSLMSLCRNKHWEMLQSFASAEIALARRLGPSAPITFGAKLAKIPDKEIPKASRDKLSAARNLLAHAEVTVVECEGIPTSIWRVADSKSELTARTFTKEELTMWTKEITAALQPILKLKAGA